MIDQDLVRLTLEDALSRLGGDGSNFLVPQQLLGAVQVGEAPLREADPAGLVQHGLSVRRGDRVVWLHVQRVRQVTGRRRLLQRQAGEAAVLGHGDQCPDSNVVRQLPRGYFERRGRGGRPPLVLVSHYLLPAGSNRPLAWRHLQNRLRRSFGLELA